MRKGSYLDHAITDAYYKELERWLPATSSGVIQNTLDTLKLKAAATKNSDTPSLKYTP
jgi:hypothetical protein